MMHSVVCCDGEHCREFIYIDCSGKGSRYDHRAEVVHPLIASEGWTVVIPDDGDEDQAKHYCEGCAPESTEDELDVEEEEGE